MSSIIVILCLCIPGELSLCESYHVLVVSFQGAYLLIFDDNFRDNFAYFFIKTYVVAAH